MRLWDTETGEEIRILTGHPRPIDKVNSVAFSPNGNIVAGSGDRPFNTVHNTVHLWDAETGEEIRILTGHPSSVFSVVFSPDGKTIVSGGITGDIRLWGVNTGRHIRTLGRHSAVVSIAFSPDSKTITSGHWKEIRLWDAETGEEIRTLTGHHTSSVSSVAFSPAGKTIASGGGDGTVMLWELTPVENETPKENPSLTGDVNADGKVNKTDLLSVVEALGEKTTEKIRTDVNADGVVDVIDLLLVIEHLDNPKDAAAPGKQKGVPFLNPAMLSAHLDILHTQNDGTLTYALAIGFLESLLVGAKPERTALLANYPNPFNPETWIPYQLAKPGNVTFTIYAIDGRVVRRLALGHQPVGFYQSRSRAAYWDGRNAVGEPVASGVYFYTLTAGDFTATRKLLIRK